MFILDEGTRVVVPRTELTYPGHNMKLHTNAASQFIFISTYFSRITVFGKLVMFIANIAIYSGVDKIKAKQIVK